MKTRRVTVHDLFLPGTGRGTIDEDDGGGAPSAMSTANGSDVPVAPLHHPADGPPPLAGEELTSAFATTLGRPDPYDPQAPLELADSVTLVAHVSKGTYIRSLARDIAHALGTVGHVTYLRRIKAGPFREEQAISLDTLEEIAKGAPLEHLLLPLEAGLDDIPVLPLDPTSAQAVRQGRVLSELLQPDGLHFAKLGAVPIALMEIEGGTAKVVRGFNLPDVAE